MKVLITGAHCSLNNGELAMIKTTMIQLRERKREIKFSIFSNYPRYSPSRYGAKTVGISQLPDKIGLNLATSKYLLDIFRLLFYFLMWRIFHTKRLLNNPVLREYHESDFILDISGDGISDDYGVSATLWHFYQLFLSVIFSKPFIILAQSIGPFKNIITRSIAKYIFNHAELITVRDSITFEYIGNFLNKNIEPIQTADIAFLLQPEIDFKKMNLRDSYPVWGISISQIISRWAFPGIEDSKKKYRHYIYLMAKVSDYLVEKYNASLIFIPHVMGPKNADDRIICKKVFEKIKYPKKVKLIEVEYSPEEMKAVIGQCDFFIGARMHSLIASLSQEVPSIALSYSHKYEGILGKIFGMQEFIIDVREYSSTELYSYLIKKINSLVERKNDVSSNLKNIMPSIRKNSIKNIDLVINHIEKKVRGTNVESLNLENLCNGCGICKVICPQKSIEMIKTHNEMYQPKIVSNCIGCKKCLQVCPVIHPNFEKIKNELFLQNKHDPYLGSYQELLVGYSKDPDLRWHSSSGGLVTQLLLYAMENGIIDGAMVTKMNSNVTLEPEVMIARNKKDIINASGSKYCPVEISNGVEYILENEGRYAVVGLPCHIQAIRKLEDENKDLKKRIVLHFGLFCSHNVSFAGTETLLKRRGININDIKHLEYRTECWPGKMKVELKDGTIRQFSGYWGELFDQFFFTPTHCTLCPDMTSELADISFGDAWLPAYRKNKNGYSILIVRSNKGERLINEAIKDEVVYLTKLSKEDVIKSQTQIIYKKRGINARLKLFKFLGRPTPAYDIEFENEPVGDYLTALITNLNIFFSSTRIGSNFLAITPSFILKVYLGVIYGIKYINGEIKNLRR